VTNLGILHKPGPKEPWIIARDGPPTRATVLDDGARWVIEPTFSDFKSRGFKLEDLQLEHADRLERLILIMSHSALVGDLASDKCSLIAFTKFHFSNRPRLKNCPWLHTP